MKGALIVGASAAGLQAAMDLADSGIQVHLVEPSPFLGTEGTGPAAPYPFHARLLEVAKHPRVKAWTNTRINRVEGGGAGAGELRVELRQHPRYIDLARCTACGDCVAVCPVAVPGTNRKAIHVGAPGSAFGGQPGCAAIDKLGKPPCSNTCPGGIHVQGYVALTAAGRYQEAIDLIREAIPFPGICGRICTHPCEVNCRRAEVDKPVAIRLLKRFLSDWELEAHGGGQDLQDLPDGVWVSPANPGKLGNPEYPATLPNTPASPVLSDAVNRVAIVGAGPGGMATAERLARMGYGVTVFEKLPVIGGMMSVGIPEYRLPRQVIAREYRHIQELGVEVRLNTPIDSVDDLFAMGYSAICLAIGAHRSHELRIPGEDLPGVAQGIDLLQTISFSQQLVPGPSSTDDPKAAYEARLAALLYRGPATRAVVLGGGNTAMDVSRSLRRFGLDDVRILYRRTRAEMPAMPEEVEDAEAEGVAIDFLVSPVRILANAASPDRQAGEGRVGGLECLRMKLGEPDTSGRRRPVPIAGSEFVMEVDLVVPAIGQAPDLDLLGSDHRLALTRQERINVDAVTFMTARSGVFACGDAVTADKMAVIEAIGMGKQAAAAIDAYVRGVPPAPWPARQGRQVAVDAREVPIARREMAPEELVPKPRLAVPTLPLAQRLGSYAEVELGYSADQAVLEAGRCLVCGPCSECQACVRACKPGAVVHDQHETLAEIDVGAILYAGQAARRGEWPALDRVALLEVDPDDPLAGSAAAAQAMFELFADRETGQPTPAARPLARAPRIGVFVCRCGGYISDRLDTEWLRDQAATWPGVIHTEVLAFSCSDQAAEAVAAAVQAHGLDRAVLAACSCCSIDQVCYSCTFQRVRCKANLGVLPAPGDFLAGGLPPGNADLSPVEPAAPWTVTARLRGLPFEFVNIREQCAWVHDDDPARREATAKAAALTAAAVARVRAAAAQPSPALGQPSSRADRSAMVLGSGPAGRVAQQALARQGVAVRHLAGASAASALRVWRADRMYHASRDGQSSQAALVVLAPKPGEEAALLAAFGKDGHRPRRRRTWGGVDTHRPGVFWCDSAQDPALVGAAAAARAAAWLGRLDSADEAIAAVVDPARCRACGTCVDLCEFGAAQLTVVPALAQGGPALGQRGPALSLPGPAEEPQRTSWIDPAVCTGCGTCAAHCPSNAITAGCCTEAQLEAMLEQLVAPAAEVRNHV